MSPTTLVAALEHAAAHADARKGFRVLGDEVESAFFSFAALERASARHGGGLQSLGLRPGDRVALVLPDPADFLLAFLGAQRAGLVPVPLYPPLVTGSLAAYTDGLVATVRQSGARFVITSKTLRPMFGAVALGAPAVRGVLSIDAIADGPELRPVVVDPEDVALLQYTSGSVGNPKGVIVTHQNLAANARAIAVSGLGLGPDDVGVSWLPLYHDMGLVGFAVTPIFAHVPVVLMSPMSFLKRPVSWLRAISRYRGTIAYAPTFAYALAKKRLTPADLDGLDLSAWRVAGCGAEPIRKAPLLEFAAALAPAGFDARAFVPSYGLAEATLAVTFAPLGRGLVTDVVSGKALADEGVALPVDASHPDAVELVRCGHAFPEHEVGVFAPRGDAPLGERVVGEIRARGPSVTRGYVDGPNPHEGGWLRTGDLGYHVDG
ncbi:MAG: AMP-binding protein, partial [Polyangiaceae bacterium]|nr:AMP-binding protein [Polyangiaceae bacterium]